MNFSLQAYFLHKYSSIFDFTSRLSNAGSCQSITQTGIHPAKSAQAAKVQVWVWNIVYFVEGWGVAWTGINVDYIPVWWMFLSIPRTYETCTVTTCRVSVFMDRTRTDFDAISACLKDVGFFQPFHDTRGVCVWAFECITCFSCERCIEIRINDAKGIKKMNVGICTSHLHICMNIFGQTTCFQWLLQRYAPLQSPFTAKATPLTPCTLLVHEHTHIHIYNKYIIRTSCVTQWRRRPMQIFSHTNTYIHSLTCK